MTRRIAILGSTGSVGVNALRIIADRRDQFEVAMLSANRSHEDLGEQIERFRPAAACLSGLPDAERPKTLSSEACWAVGASGILEALEAARPDVVLNAITGAAGLPASEWTLRQGLTLALANKESLVIAGEYLMGIAAANGSTILPVDSEHCAIFQCLDGERRESIRKIYLTASGGPFRERSANTMATVTREEALNHPTWDMGPRITIGSATMMNKAFEVLEARWLFGLQPEQIDILVHPQSIVHSMVEFVDGSMLAQLGLPDMRVPILYCLAYPDRVPFDFAPFDPIRFASLTFEPVDVERFPAVALAYEALRAGGDSGAVLNAADEVMTGAFLNGQVSFPAIAETVARIVREHQPSPIRSLTDALAADRLGREAAEAAVAAVAPIRTAPIRSAGS